jgi:vWA-MoxR associated protein C-terminal domain/Caspase domain
LVGISVMAYTSANTVAIIVAIEDYEISSGLEADARWDLDGPSSDAVRFAKWLKKQLVPALNIYVFQSAINRAAREAELIELGIIHLFDAKQNTLENFFLNRLPHLAPSEDGQLFILWGGHGILRASEERHLYCADVLPNTIRTIWLNDLLRLLRGGVGFSRQYVFVDACANAHEDTGLNRPFYHRLSTDGSSSGVEQYAFLASSAGQLAMNQRDSHSGLFSTYLFEALEALNDWPHFKTLEEVVSAGFDAKVSQDSTFSQRPVSLTVEDHTNRSWTRNYGGTPVPRSFQALAESTDYSVGALQKLVVIGTRCRSLANTDSRGYFYRKFNFKEPLFRADDDYDCLNLLGRILLADHTAQFLAELRARESDVGAYAELELAFQHASLVRKARIALRPLEIETSEYRRLFSLVQPSSKASNLEEILESLSARGPLGSSAIFEFFFRVADCGRCNDPSSLLTWVKQHANAQHYADLEEGRRLSRTYAVVVSIKPRFGKDEIPESITVWLLENGRATGKVWTQTFDVGRTPDTLAEEVIEQLEQTLEEAIGSVDGPVFVEIAIPMGLMRWNFNQLGIKHPNSKFKRPLGREHPVVVRWRDRQRRNSIWSRPWCKAGAFIRSCSTTNPPKWWLLPNEPDESFLGSLENPVAQFLYMGTPQQPLQENDPDWLQEAIIAGTPFGGWMVSPVPDLAKMPKLLDELLEGEFDQLPLRVPYFLRDTLRSDLRSLVLLWDDPKSRHTVLLEEPA